MSTIKMISVEVLDYIINKYKLRRDIRARKEIELNITEVPFWGRWVKPEEASPNQAEMVLVVISGKGHNTIYEHALLTASWFDDEGWLLEIEQEPLEFTVEYWTRLPELPEGWDDV